MRYDHSEDYKEEQQIVELELKLRKTVSYYAAYKRLNYCAEYGQTECIEECLKVFILNYQGFIGIQGRILCDILNRRINKVLFAHEGAEYL